MSKGQKQEISMRKENMINIRSNGKRKKGASIIYIQMGQKYPLNEMPVNWVAPALYIN